MNVKKAAFVLLSTILFCAFAQAAMTTELKLSPLTELEIANADELFSGGIDALALEDILLSNIALNFSGGISAENANKTTLGEFENFNLESAYIFSNDDVEVFNAADAILSELGRGIGISNGRENQLSFYEAGNRYDIYFSSFSFLSIYPLIEASNFQIFYLPEGYAQIGSASAKAPQEFIVDDDADGDEQTEALISDCLNPVKTDKIESAERNFSPALSLNILIFTKDLHYYSGSSASLSAPSIQISTINFENDSNIEIEITDNFKGGNIIGSIDGLGNIVLDVYYDNTKPMSIGFYEYKNSNFKLSPPKHIEPHGLTIATSRVAEADEKYIENLDAAAAPFLMAIQNPAGNIIFKHLNNSQNLNSEQDIAAFSIWFTPYYSYTLGAGSYLNVKTLNNERIAKLKTDYSIESPGIALGADLFLGNGVIIGANAMVDKPQYFALGQSYNEGYLIRGALFGGIRTGLDIMFFVASGHWDYSQRRNSQSDYEAQYGAKQYEAGLGFAKAIEVSDKTRMRPFIDYEYISLSIDDYAEMSKATYAIIYEYKETRTHQARFGLFTDFNAAGSVSFTMGAYYRGLYGDRISKPQISFQNGLSQDKFIIEHKLLQDSFGAEAILTISLGEDMNIVLDYTLLLNPLQENHKAQAMWTIKF
jgi:hypothetical protein